MSISISGSGAITGASTSYSFDQSVSIAGTVTYEDVTNVDSVGVITARNGIHATGSGNLVGIGTTNPESRLHIYGTTNSHIRMTNTTSDGLDLIGDANRSGSDQNIFLIRSKWNGTDVSRIVFRSGSDTTDKDDGHILFQTKDSGSSLAERLRIKSDGNVGIGTDDPIRPLHFDNASQASFLLSGTAPQIRFNSSATDGLDADRVILARSGAGDQFISGSADGDAILRCATSKKVMIGYGTTEIAQFNSSGLKFKTSGMGIDFSETADGTGTMTSELLDDYEEGTFTPTLTFSTPGTSSFTYSVNAGHYTKIGNLAYYRLEIRLSAFSKGTASGDLRVEGFPFTAANLSNGQFVGSLATFNTPMSTDAGDAMIFAASQNAATGFFKTIRSNDSWIAVPDPDSNSQYKISVNVLTA